MSVENQVNNHRMDGGGDDNGQTGRRQNLSVSSDSSSASDSSSDFVFYSQRPDWTDIKPVAQDDGPHPVVAIAYSDRFRDTFDYFRAILAKNEMSARALLLTEDCAKLNPSNYTIWYFRRLIIQELRYDLNEELQYIRTVIGDNAKNYQVWHHRKCIVEQIKQQIVDKYQTKAEEKDDNSSDMARELSDLVAEEKDFVTIMLRQDSKNYHGWQHRQWLIKDFAVFDSELDYTAELMDDDIRNNSAWNHRYYVIANTTGFVGSVLDSEIQFTCHKISLAPNNESAWNYLRGILDGVSVNSSSVVSQLCDELYKSLETHRSPHLLAFMIEAIDETLSRQQQTEPDQQLLRKALDYCQTLSTRIDTIRTEYWNYIARDLNQRFAAK